MATGSAVETSGTSNSGSPSPDQLVDDIEVVRERLAATIDQITDRANPKNVARRRFEDLRARFVAPDGSPRVENIAPVAGAAVGTVALLAVIRRLVRR